MEPNEPTNQRTTERIGSLRVYAVHAPRFAQEGDDQSGRGREGRVQYFVGAPAGGRGRGAHRGARQAPNRCGLYGAWLYYLSWFGGRLVVFLSLSQLRPLCSCFSSPSCHRQCLVGPDGDDVVKYGPFVREFHAKLKKSPLFATNPYVRADAERTAKAIKRKPAHAVRTLRSLEAKQSIETIHPNHRR